MAAFAATFNPESTRLIFKLTHYPARAQAYPGATVVAVAPVSALEVRAGTADRGWEARQAKFHGRP
jgi:hypothetical protein